MIYTLGLTAAYEKYFEEQECPRKGVGGSVWRTQEEAEEHLGNSHVLKVYGVKADWDKDTAGAKDGDPWRSLIRDADLIKL